LIDEISLHFSAEIKNEIRRGDLAISFDRHNIFASWSGQKEDLPIYLEDLLERQRTVVFNTGNVIKSVDFFPLRNDVVIFTTDDSLQVVEIDRRPVQNVFEINKVEGGDLVKVINDEIYLQRRGEIFVLDL